MSTQINTSASQELDGAVQAVEKSGANILSDSEMKTDDFYDVQSKFVEIFNKKSAYLKSMHPGLHQTSLARLQNSLLLDSAVAIGRTYLEKAKRSIITCSMEEGSKSVNEPVDECFSKAKKSWVEGVESTKLGKKWPSSIGSSITDAAGEAQALTALSMVADATKASRRALSTFQQCAQTAGLNLDACIEKANLECIDGVGCQESILSASVRNEVESCEKASHLKLEKSLALLDAWWQLDSSKGWLSAEELMDEASTSFEHGPCAVRNSTKAFNDRDQILKILASVSESRTYAAQSITRYSLVVAIFLGTAFAYNRFFLAERKAISSQSNKLKVQSSMLLNICFAYTFAIFSM
jgi:hypothetical protein